MILDWYSYCETVHSTKKLLTKDPADHKSLFKQEIFYVRYLIYKKHYTKLQCYTEWRKIKNGRANILKKDPDQLAIEFFNIYQAANRINRIPGPLSEIIIFKDEVDYLNSLQVPKWIKEFWMAELIYYKFATQIYSQVELTPTVLSWCLRQVTDLKASNRTFFDHRDQIGKYNAQFEVIKINNLNNHEYNIMTPKFLNTDNKSPVLIINNLDQIKTGIKLIKDNYEICENCGKKFIKSSKSQTQLCTGCYKKYRRKYKTEKQKKYDDQKSLEKIREN